MVRIDLKSMLQRTVSDLYGDLVTRPTGRAVRSGIEGVLASEADSDVAVIDFSTVGCLDYSCADEIVGRLLLDHGGVRYILLRGVSLSQRDAIEPVLERHSLTVIAADRNGRVEVLGTIPDDARRAFAVLYEGGAAGLDEVAARLAVPADLARRALEELLARRLVQTSGGAYRALTLA
jgi:hypothetical protein